MSVQVKPYQHFNFVALMYENFATVFPFWVERELKLFIIRSVYK